MATAYLRAYLEKENQKKNKFFVNKNIKSDYLLIFDTETTIDLLQNLKVGFFIVIYNKTLIDNGYFYN